MRSHVMNLGLAGVSAMLLSAATGACQNDGGQPNDQLDGDQTHPALAQTTQAVVYAGDDRQDWYAFADMVWRDRITQATVALLDTSALTVQPNGDVTIAGPTLQESLGVCPGERFAGQMTAARCTGTLIADDMVLTSGQCIADAAACAATSLVFDFRMSDATTLAPVTTDQVYGCADIVARARDNAADYAFIRLDRPVTPARTPATLRFQDVALAANAPLITGGHPSGLPLKIDASGTVRDGRPLAMDYFVAEMDTFTGSTGAGVFDPGTGELLGVVARGELDYIPDPGGANCTEVNQCAPGACTGERVTYANRALQGMCGDDVCLAGFEDTTTCAADCGSVCGDGVCNGVEAVTNCNADCGTCGNGACDPGEDSANCHQDCGSDCGDNACNGAENPDLCPEDCTCGDGVCDAGIGEDSTTCCRDCACADDTLERCSATDACVYRGDLCGDPGAIDVTAIIAAAEAADPGSVPAITIAGETFTANANYAGSCVDGDSPERIYAFTLSGRTTVRAWVSADYDTAIYLREVCADDSAANEIACNDESPSMPGRFGAALDVDLAAGSYHLMVDGYAGDSGAYQLSMEFELTCPDADGDLVCDESDGCPEDPDKDMGGVCGCATFDDPEPRPDTDSDVDGVPNCIDECPIDGLKTLAGECGCGTPEGECSGCGCDVGRAETLGAAGARGAGLLSLLLLWFACTRLRRRRRDVRHGGC